MTQLQSCSVAETSACLTRNVTGISFQQQMTAGSLHSQYTMWLLIRLVIPAYRNTGYHY